MLISQSSLEKTLNEALSTGADFAEIFAEDSYSSLLSMVDSKPKTATVGRQYGAGIRIHFGNEEIYVTTNDLSENGLLKAAKIAAQARPAGERKMQTKNLHPDLMDSVHTYGDLPWQIDRDKKFGFLSHLDQLTRKKSQLVTQAVPRLMEKVQRVLIANSLGKLVEDQRTHYRTTLEVIVEEGGLKESFFRDRFSVLDAHFFESLNVEEIANETVNSALTILRAPFAPAGEMPVVIDSGFGGVIFHEACGHGLETTAVAPKTSIFSEELNKKVADTCVTAIDDGTIEGCWGTQKYDDEGNLTRKTTLIENGILKSFMVDELGKKKTGYEITGSGRRQNYKYAPTSRMRNTYIAAGKSSLDEMIKDVDHGIYAKNMGGGSVDTGTGDFNFNVREAYVIRNGKIDHAVKGASLIGRGIEALGRITKVGSEIKHAAGMCGSVSGTIPAAVGQPALLISKILVGGRA